MKQLALVLNAESFSRGEFTGPPSAWSAGRMDFDTELVILYQDVIHAPCQPACPTVFIYFQAWACSGRLRVGRCLIDFPAFCWARRSS
jgi:hypothetical protein